MSSLSHHGIKGQKWGVRRYQNKDGTRTALGKMRHEKDTVIKAGTNLNRITGNENEVNEGYAYMSIISEDHEIYKQEASLGVYDRTTGKLITEIYDTQHTVTKDIHVPSFSNSIKAFEKVMADQDIDEIAKEVGDAYGSDGERHAQEFKNNYLNRDKASCREDAYYNFISSIGSEKNRKLLFDELKAEGYDAIWDENDRYEGWMKTPLIIFDRGEHTNQTSATKLKHTSIGGTMYIEGNALILGDSSYLEHHGILGQKWGVRRFQNKDGTRTAAGKARDQKNAAKSVVLSTRRTRNSWQYQNAFTKAQDKLTNDSKSAVRKMAIDALNGERKAEYEAAVDEYDAATNYRYDEYLKEDNKYLAIAGMASGQRYPMLDTDKFDQDTRLKWDAEFYMYDDGDQGKYNSYDYFLVAKGENPNKVFDRAMKARNNIESIAKKDADDILGDTKDRVIKGKVKDRTVSDELAYQITEMAISASDYTMVWEHGIPYSDDEIKQMKQDIDKYSKEAARLGLTHSALFIEDGTLYLSHHGIKGQRWGVRRFQNRDGSLTNAGRKRLGYATKGAAQTVGKAFKAGVKAGGNAVKAAKAHHEKAEAKKIEKKKEKASKTRLGVMANKDLFTNEEIRKLNERFKLEDEMKMATLQKGVEIAKAVGVIAQNVGTVAKAYEDVTGTSLSPIKKAKQEAEAKEKAEDRKRKLAKEDAETKRAEDKEKRDIEDRERRIKFEDEDRVRKQAKEDADAQRAENAEKRAQAKEQRDSSMAVELQRKAKAAADEQEHKVVKAKAESRSAILDVLDKINKIQDHDDDDDHNNPPGGGVDTWNDDDYLNFFKKTGIIHSDISDPSLIQNGVLFVDESVSLSHHGVKGQRWGVRRFQNPDGSLTEKGRKHYEKAIEKLDRKQVNSDNRRGALERQHPFAVTASAILTGSAYAALMVASAANPATIALGTSIVAAVSALGTHVDYSVAEAWEARGTKRRKKKRKEYEEMLNHDGLMVLDGTLYLEHHGIKGQRWGVRRFQNPDGTRTEAGKKHDAKLAAKAEKKAAKIAAKDAKRSAKAEKIRAKAVERYERKAALSRRESEAEAYKLIARDTKKASQKELLSDQKVSTTIAVGQGILGAIGLATYGVPTVAAIAGGAAIVGIMRNYNLENVRTGKTLNNLRGAEKERLAKSRATDQIMDDWREEGLGVRHYEIQNGTLFIDAGEPYLEHHGVLGMKWGKHLRAGKGPADAPASAGGGGGEDDEKLKEMAKKAGMSVAEYRTKMAGKLGGAASKVGEKVYDAAGGSHKKNAEGWRKMAQEESNAARASEKSSHENSARAASQDRKYGSGGDVYRRAAESDKENAKTHHSNAKARSERAASEQAAYEKSLAGKYDKMKADRARKKSAKEAKKLSQTNAKAKKLVLNRSGSSGNTRNRGVYQILPEDSSGAARPKAERKKITRKAVGEALYNIAGGNAKKAAQEHHRNMVNYKNEADRYSRDANIEGSAAKAHKRAGNVSAYVGAKTGARVDEENAKNYRLAQYSEAEEANKAQKRYDRSLAGLYDKATGKYKQVHKQTKTPSLSKQYQYYTKEVNGKLFDHGKPKTAKERAKAEVWNAADYRIKAQDYYNQSFDPTVTTYGYDTAYRKAAVDQGRLAEGAYRRAAALGKQASKETSTSSRPRARKKKHTSGGSGVTVRRPGRKPVSRTKRITKSSTGVKRRRATGTGARVRRGA